MKSPRFWWSSPLLLLLLWLYWNNNLFFSPVWWFRIKFCNLLYTCTSVQNTADDRILVAMWGRKWRTDIHTTSYSSTSSLCLSPYIGVRIVSGWWWWPSALFIPSNPTDYALKSLSSTGHMASPNLNHSHAERYNMSSTEKKSSLLQVNQRKISSSSQL